MGDDLTARNALQRSISSRLHACDEEELRALDRMLIAVEKRRDILDVGGQVSSAIAAPVEVSPLRERDVLRGLDELRDSQTYSPREVRVPVFTVIDGGEQ